MALKWQTGAVATITLSGLLLILLNLSGMSYSHDGDKFCIDCYSEIRIKSTYWEIKVEHAGDKDVVFKKRTRSRTLWVNLDKIDELVTTDPKVKVDILVPAIKRTSTIKHEEYGYLRPLKSGDTLIKRNTIARPSLSRIILHGNKAVDLTVKWNFDLEHWLSEDINIDPVWFGVGVTYDESCVDNFVNVDDYGTCQRNFIYVNNVTNKNETRSQNYNCKIGRRLENQPICVKTGVNLDGSYGKVKFKWKDSGFNCKLDGFEFVCDSIYDGNGDGICTSGESCITIDVRNLNVTSDLDTPSIKGFKIE